METSVLDPLLLVLVQVMLRAPSIVSDSLYFGVLVRPDLLPPELPPNLLFPLKLGLDQCSNTSHSPKPIISFISGFTKLPVTGVLQFNSLKELKKRVSVLFKVTPFQHLFLWNSVS